MGINCQPATMVCLDNSSQRREDFTCDPCARTPSKNNGKLWLYEQPRQDNGFHLHFVPGGSHFNQSLANWLEGIRDSVGECVAQREA